MRRLAIVLAAALCALPAAAAPQRWDLADLYPTAAAWQAEQGAAQQRLRTLDRFKGTLGQDAAALRTALLAISDARRTMARLATWANLLADEDLREPRGQERRQQVEALYAQLGETTAWLAPEIQAVGSERIAAFVAADAVLKSRFDHLLADTLRSAPHTLTPEAEAVLAAAGPVLAQPGMLFQQLADAELPMPVVTLSDGRRVRLSTPLFEQLRTSPVRADRERVFDAFFGAFARLQGSLGANLNTQVLANVYTARARRFGSALEAALFADAMPPAVHRRLLDEAAAGLPVLHRYLALRKKMLGIRGPLGYHDNYPPLVRAPAGLQWPLERAQAVTLQALAPLGDEYLGLLKRGFAARWTDSHPRAGKASGAYVSGGAYDVHPYVLLNHADDYESLTTFAHEWGHAVHTQLANAAQPFDKADYSTFIAESASIGNEMLLADHLVATAATRAEKLFYLAQALETIRTTFFRQAMFAEFQLALHGEVEAGRPLSGARMSELYCGIARRYYGEKQGVMRISPRHCTEWAYVGHFFAGFYVWQYATSIAGAAQLTETIGREGAPARERFLALLKAGGSGDAYALYVKAGVDLAQPEPYRALMARMNRLLDEFERLAAAPLR